MIRLNKYLKDQGFCSRREADRWIEEGIVTVNGESVRELGVKIDPAKDVVSVETQIVSQKEEEKIVLALNKPRGYSTTMKHTQGEKKIVTDLVRIPQRVFPVGRLDKETTGLLLLTNDGELSYRLTHPSFEHEKEYEVVVNKPLTNGVLQKIEKGVPLFGEKTLPTEVEQLSSRVFRIVLKEGKNRQIRRICRKVGYEVLFLKRIRIGKFVLPNIPEGKSVVLSERERKLLEV